MLVWDDHFTTIWNSDLKPNSIFTGMRGCTTSLCTGGSIGKGNFFVDIAGFGII